MGARENQNVSVIILTKNSAQTIGTCLKSVICERPREIIAVDGESQDGTLSILKDYGVKIITDASRSLGRSRQLGVEAATGNYVMFVDSDVELTAGCIMRMRAEIENFGWVGIHAMIVGKENLTYWQNAVNTIFSGFNQVGPKSQIGTIAALFRRSTLLETPFDPDLIDAAEDIDLCLRLGRRGLLVGVSHAVAYHHHRRDFLAFVRQCFRNGKGEGRLGRKYGSARTLVRPLERTLVLSIRSILGGRASLVPYWFVYGCAEFAGIIAFTSNVGKRSNFGWKKHP